MIKRIIDVRVTRYCDNDQTVAYVHWIGARGEHGYTIGDPNNLHMQALIARALREHAPVVYDTAGWLPPYDGEGEV